MPRRSPRPETRQGGPRWVFLQYLLGFRRLADVYSSTVSKQRFARRRRPGRARRAVGEPSLPPRRARPLGLGESFAVACDGGREWVGCRRRVRGGARFGAPAELHDFTIHSNVLAAPLRRVLRFDPGLVRWAGPGTWPTCFAGTIGS